MKFGHILSLLSSFSGVLLPTAGRPQEVKPATDGPRAFSSNEGDEFVSGSYLDPTMLNEPTRQHDGRGLIIVLPTSDEEEESSPSHSGFVLKSADDQPMMAHSLLFPPRGLTKKQQDDVKLAPQVLVGRKLQATQTWIQRGADIDGEALADNFGSSISLSDDGNVLAVSAPNNDGASGTASDNRGHVRVYKYDSASSVWVKLGNDIIGEASADQSGVSISLSDDGNVLAVGAIYNDGTSSSTGDNRGHVRVYKYDATSSDWIKLGNDIDGEATGDQSGRSVSLSGDGTVVAIGAVNNDGASITASDNRGHVRVYKYNAAFSDWIKRGNDIDGEAAGDQSGYSISLSDDGNIVAIGAVNNDGTSGINSDNRGHVRVYKYDATSIVWNKIGNDIDGEAPSDYSGRSVSLSGDGTVLAAGTVFNDGNGNAAGHVRVLKYDATSNVWKILGADIDGQAAGSQSGASVSLSDDGTVLAVGAINMDGISGNIGNRGQVRIYKYDVTSSAWTRLGNDIDGEAAGDQSGYSVSLSSDGNVLAVGANQNSNSRGHVRVFLCTPITSSPSASPSLAPTNTPTTESPSSSPTNTPTTASPSFAPTNTPTTASPSFAPTTSTPTTESPSFAPTASPSFAPTNTPTSARPSFAPTASPSFAPTNAPTTASPSSAPTDAPTSVNPSFTPTIISTTASPSSSPTNAPTTTNLLFITIAPTKSPIIATLSFVGGCPAQISEDAVTAGGHYRPGERVSKGAIVFECKSWPNSLFCSQAAFIPPNDVDSTSTDWKQAWDVIGYCAGTLALPTAGCPDVWTSGDMTKYKENDQVSMIKSSSPLTQVIYKCKAWPYSWYCGQLSPLNRNGGVLGWDLVGECAGTISPTSSPSFDPLIEIIAGCPDEYKMDNYMAGDKVSVAIKGSPLYKNVYVCREFPYSGYCSQRGFAPGEQYDYMAWTLLGPCDGTLAPTSTPTSYSGGALCTYTKVVTTTPTPTPVITPVGTWTAGTLYEAGDQVRIGSKKFQCKPWPFYLWCRMSAYSPTLSTGLWTEAWTDAGTCPI